jgi:hypothetical protein
VGIIAIPGMMTGAILGGSSVDQAAKLQSKPLPSVCPLDISDRASAIIMFSLSSSTALGSIMATIFCLALVTDPEHRIREERIDSTKHPLWKTRDKLMKAAADAISDAWSRLRKHKPAIEIEPRDTLELRQGLLSASDR